ncbi:helix-turn-helix transcriptional regulator [Bifidobacterium pullorum subsp. saeculare]|uniref:Helix-turn-helix transcriptional regulator n=1 Tax=Bifidobacterium pullorum subsp. saeculare TaxID=78257 RepID=A0A938WVV2_9BIFI|nr:helix-turn-helix transcriptional regulator [Bifidobacterium pullorum]MBM6699189.1 helix-turn-helix transcriptional regulator [Bifidobacterium pullorum subsp. saeculare]
MGIHDQITADRMSHACDLLGSTALPVTQVAAECGYADPRYFMRVFKRRMGVTPTRYRDSFSGTLFNTV